MKQYSVESTVAYIFTLRLKARDHTKSNFNYPQYSLWMSFKGPHNIMVTALDNIVKWPFEYMKKHPTRPNAWNTNHMIYLLLKQT
jgi:hypothetical protein